MRFLTNNPLLPERPRLQKRARFVMAEQPDSGQRYSVKSMRSQAERKANSGTGFLIVFALFWCGLVGAFDAFVIPAFIHQVQSTWYQPATAVILESKLKQNDDTTGVAVSYRYTVNGQEYTSDRYSFNAFSSSDSAWARSAVRDYPAESERTCYFDPAKPNRAVLKRGIDGSDVFNLMFMTPFNMIGLVLIWALINSRKEESYQPAPRVVDRFQNRESYLMTPWTPFGSFLGTFGLGTFLALFIVAIPSGFHPSVAKVCGIWGGVVLLAISFAILAACRNASGRYDLALDHNNRMLTLPKMHKRVDREILPYTNVHRIEARTIKTGSGEDQKTEHKIFLVTKDGAEHLLKSEISEARAARLAETLSGKIGV